MSKIKRRILEYLKIKGISKASFYEVTGIAASNFKGAGAHSEIGGDKIAKILTIYDDLNADWLITGRGKTLLTKTAAEENIFVTKTPEKVINSHDTYFDNQNDTFPKLQNRLSNKDVMITEQQVPVYESVTLQSLESLFSNSLKPNSYLSLPNLPKCDGAVRMWGDTMSPELQSGDLLVYKKVKDLRNGLFLGQIYLLSVELDGEEYIMVQYVEQSDIHESVKLVSKNERYPAKDVPLDSIKALAMIKASVRYRAI